jgi:hypothetical protein
MGLAAGYRAAKEGHSVDVIEAAPEPGGMAGHFDFGGLSLERFYHFACLSDHPTFELMNELGIGDKMKWRKTTMGYFDGRLHAWGDPISLFKYPGLSLREDAVWTVRVCVRAAEQLGCDRARVGEELDFAVVWAVDLRPVLEAAVRVQVLWVCGEYFGVVDMDADPAHWAVAQEHARGAAGVYRGRDADAGECADGRHQGAWRASASGNAGVAGNDGGWTRYGCADGEQTFEADAVICTAPTPW